MPSILVDQWTYDRLAFIEKATGLAPASTLRSMLERLDAPNTISSRTTDSHIGERPLPPAMAGVAVPVHADYRGSRVEGTFDPVAMRVQITSGPLSGQGFDSPTAAAVAVVRSESPERTNPETNGRKFWKRNDGGGDLRTLIGQRF